MAAMMREKSALRWARIFRMLWPQPHSTAKRAPREASIGFHVADFRLDGAAAPEVSDQPRRQVPACAADQHAGFVDAMATISAVDDGEVGLLVGQDFHLLQRRAKGMTIVRIARKAAHADDKALVQRCGNADLATKFITHQRFAL